MQLFDKRPPFVRFEEQEYGRDLEASERAGRPIPRTVVMACITPFASKDEVIKPADEWLKQIRDQAVKGEYPPEWAERFRLQFEEWRKGHELPREGTPIRTWQMLTAEQRNRLRALNILIVEDLALIPDSGLSMLGLDGRSMRDTAKGWIAEGHDKGINAKALADANVKIEAQEKIIEDLRERLRRLEDQADAKTSKRERAA